MITHLFYHQGTVEEVCALNSWNSIKGFFSEEDEVIFLDLGNTIKDITTFSNINVKYFNVHKIRTDKPQERSYTYGFNNFIPKARSEWVVIWRSDYIYAHYYYDDVLKCIEKGASVVLPYECFFGAYYCDGEWCKRKLKGLIEKGEDFMLKHSTVIPVFETLDFAHFAIKKQSWVDINGMDDRLYGYGWQFPEFFLRLRKQSSYKPEVGFNMHSFHQCHAGSFSMKKLDDDKLKEVEESKLKLISVYGSLENAEKELTLVRNNPLLPRRPAAFYISKSKKNVQQMNSFRSAFKKFMKRGLRSRFGNKKVQVAPKVFETEEAYYKHLFTEDPKWSGKEPNREESTRLMAIIRLVEEARAYWLEKNISKPEIVDFGCGRGWLSNKLLQFGNVTGIEPVKPVIEYAKTMYPDLNLKLGSLDVLAQHTPHMIVSSEVLEHIPFESQQEFFDSFYQSLLPDGFCIITTPRAEAYEEWLSYHDSTQPVEDWLTESQVENLAVKAGFKKVNLLRLQERPKKAAPPIELYQLWLFQK